MEGQTEKNKKLTISGKAAGIVLAGAVALGSAGTVATQAVIEGADAPRTEAAAETKDYTMLFYVTGSDLESSPDGDGEAEDGAASGDMREIVTAMGEYGLDERVNVVAQIGGTRVWADESLAGVQSARAAIDSGGIHVLEELPDTNMGNSGTLTEFIDYACQAYPAEHYLMVFWNHGNGPTDGFGYDTLHGGDSLTLKELNDGFRNAKTQAFDLIGFDACCMGNMETVHALSAFADYFVGSPACEDVNGWDYLWMEVLAKEDVTAKEIGARIVDRFDNFYKEMGNESITATLSCYDMAAYRNLYEVLRGYNAQLWGTDDISLCEQVSSARSRMAGYYSGGRPGEPLELLDFEQVYRVLDEEGWEAQGLGALMDQFVCRTNVDTEGMSGISLYMPGGQSGDLAEQILYYLNCLYDENYLKFVYRYATMLDQDLEMEMENLTAEFSEDSTEISFRVDEELAANTAAAYLVTAFPVGEDDKFCLLSTDSELYDSGNGIWTGILDIKYFSIAGELLCLIEQYSGEDRTEYLSPIRYNGKLCIMTVEVSLEYPDGRIVSIIPYHEDGQAGKEQYVLEEGAYFAALYPVFPENGEDIFAEAVTEDNYCEGDTVQLWEYDLELELTDVEFSQCCYGLMIKDKNLGTHFSGLTDLTEF